MTKRLPSQMHNRPITSNGNECSTYEYHDRHMCSYSHWIGTP
uniref:Uncharacterized protein n=1 Tax=Rhizophora mucronata TaxID=61149 RepID=A0A2P2QZW2_RHIMU